MKTIIELAREAGMPDPMVFKASYQRFHDLTIAQYREGLLDGVGEPTLEVETEPDHWHNGRFYEDTGRSYISETAIGKLPIGTKLYTADQLAAAVAIERERCAKVCERIDAEYEGEDVLATWRWSLTYSKRKSGRTGLYFMRVCGGQGFNFHAGINLPAIGSLSMQTQPHMWEKKIRGQK